MACAVGGADRACRACGVVVVGNGPGLASVVNGVAHAALDRVPLLVISDRYTEAELATTGHQILDQRALLAPVVKWSATLADASRRRRWTTRSRVALPQHPCGPVHLDMPRTVGGEAAAAHATAPAARRLAAPRRHATRPSTRPSPATSPVRGADARVTPRPASRRPSRGGLERPGDLRSRARGAARRARPHHLQGQGRARRAASAVGRESSPAGRSRRPVLEAADAILAVGLDPVELLTKPWPCVAPLLALRAGDVGAGYGSPAGPLDRRRRRGRPGARRAAAAAARRATSAPSRGALDALRIGSESALTALADRRDRSTRSCRTTRSRRSTRARTCSPRRGSGARTRRAGS